MAIFTNPIPRTGLPNFHEASPQRSQRDSDAVARHWSKNKTVSHQVFTLAENVRQLQRQLDRLRVRNNSDQSSGGGSAVWL